MWRQVSFIPEEKGGGISPASDCEAVLLDSLGGDSEDDRVASPFSCRGLPQALVVVKNMWRSPNRSSSSRRGESSDLVSERTPESSLAEEELLSPLLREWTSADDSEVGVTSAKERLTLRLGATSIVLISAGGGMAVTSDPGENVLLDLLRFMEGGGGLILGMTCLYL